MLQRGKEAAHQLQGHSLNNSTWRARGIIISACFAALCAIARAEAVTAPQRNAYMRLRATPMLGIGDHSRGVRVGARSTSAALKVITAGGVGLPTPWTGGGGKL